jgi:quercetin dioxygenase-like cupin family protein
LLSRFPIAAIVMLLFIGCLMHGDRTYGDAKQVPEIKSAFANLTGRVVRENDRVLVTTFTIEPGQSTGTQMHSTDSLLVFVKGGVLSSDQTHRATLWKDGRVLWRSMANQPTAGYTNTGSTPIEVILVALKPRPTGIPSDTNESAEYYLNYPNIPGEDILENESVVVQQFHLNPGQWEGVHAHVGNQLWIFIKGGLWSSKTRNTAPTTPQFGPDGTVGWMPAIDINQGHESGNVGTTSRDVVWITLKH